MKIHIIALNKGPHRNDWWRYGISGRWKPFDIWVKTDGHEIPERILHPENYVTLTQWMNDIPEKYIEYKQEFIERLRYYTDYPEGIWINKKTSWWTRK